MNVNKLLEEVLKEITPNKDEISKSLKIANDLIKLLKKQNLNAFIGGSFAKGTVVRRKEKQDLDIFVVFKTNEELEKLDEVLRKINLPGILKKVHGSRDYFQIICDEFIIELVPVLENSFPKNAENVTDFSLSHVKYVVKEIFKNKKLADEIRLSKAFCEAQKIYGAETYIGGFSGYSLEILTIHFGSFESLLRNLVSPPSKYREGDKIVIDPKRHFKEKKEILREINASKLTGPIILIDPTYKYRNVSAGLGEETFKKFQKVAKEFLDNPSKDFFKEKEFNKNEWIKRNKKSNQIFIELSLSTKKEKKDIAAAKMKKLFNFVVCELNRCSQKVKVWEFVYEENSKNAKGFLIVEEKKEVEIKGPPIKLKEASEKFKRNKTNIFKKSGHFWFKEECGIKNVLEKIRKVQSEMGVEVIFKVI